MMEILICPYCRRTDSETREARKRTKIKAILFAIMFGVLGAHRFYMGHRREGLWIFALSMTIVGLSITLWWVLFDLIRLIAMSKSEFENYACRC